MEMLVSMPLLQMMLLVIMFLAVFVEIKTGGMGAGILLGVVAACVFWGSRYFHGTAELYQIAVFLAGILCLTVEMLLPTVGLLAGIGVAAILYSVVLALGGDIHAVYMMTAAFLAAVGIFALIVRKLPASRLWNKLVLHDRSRSVRGYVSAEPRDGLLGLDGIAVTDLRPAGTVKIRERPVDVVTEGAFLSRGTPVTVVEVQGGRVVVRRKDTE